MSASGYGALGAIVLVVAVGVANAIDVTGNYAPAEATIFRIDRNCSFVRTYEGATPPGQPKAETIKQDCSATDEFKAVASATKRTKDVDGTAVVKLTYTAPQDGSSQTGELKFDGHDEQFYKLRAGDRVKILVANKDPSKIRAN
jgi:hypothetical protein